MGPALSFLSGDSITMWTRLGLPAGGWEASAVLFIPAFPASPSSPTTLADAPDMWMKPANVTWKRDEPAQLSPAQTAYPQNWKQINDCCFKGTAFQGVCFTAKATWYTDFLITTFVNQTWKVLFSIFLPVQWATLHKDLSGVSNEHNMLALLASALEGAV